MQQSDEHKYLIRALLEEFRENAKRNKKHREAPCKRKPYQERQEESDFSSVWRNFCGHLEGVDEDNKW